jgi:hypothetical protein
MWTTLHKLGSLACISHCRPPLKPCVAAAARSPACQWRTIRLSSQSAICQTTPPDSVPQQASSIACAASTQPLVFYYADENHVQKLEQFPTRISPIESSFEGGGNAGGNCEGIAMVRVLRNTPIVAAFSSQRLTGRQRH